jgi:hypothetical protein
MRRPVSEGLRTFGTLPNEDALEVQYKEKPAYMKKNSNSSNEQKKVLVKEQSEQKLFLMKLRQPAADENGDGRTGSGGPRK